MPRQINFVTDTTTLPGGGNGWVYVRPSSPYHYNDGTTVQDVPGALTDYRVQSGKIINPGGSPVDTIFTFPNTGASNDPSDTYWIVEMDLAGSYQILYRLRLTDILADYGNIEIGDIDPDAIVLGDAVTTVANDALLLASGASPGDVYDVTVSANNGNVQTTYQLKVGGNPAVIGDWTIVTTLWSDLILTSSELLGLVGGGLTDIQAHVGDADPHGQYLLRSDSSETSTGGAASDGLGDAVRAKAINGKIDGSFFDANDIPIAAPGNGVTSTDLQGALDELATEYIRDGGDTVTGQYILRDKWIWRDTVGNTDIVEVVPNPNGAVVRVTNDGAKIVTRNATPAPNDGERAGLRAEDDTGTARWVVSWHAFKNRFEIHDANNGDVAVVIGDAANSLFEILNRNMSVDRTGDAVNATLSILADGGKIGRLRLGSGTNEYFVQVNANGELSILKNGGTKPLKLSAAEVLTFNGREVATWYGGGEITSSGTIDTGTDPVGKQGNIGTGTGQNPNQFTIQKTGTGAYKIWMPSGLNTTNFTFSFCGRGGILTSDSLGATNISVNMFNLSGVATDLSWWFQGLILG